VGITDGSAWLDELHAQSAINNVASAGLAAAVAYPSRAASVRAADLVSSPAVASFMPAETVSVILSGPASSRARLHSLEPI